MNVMVAAARRAARHLARDFGEVEQLQVSKKGPADFVTEADHKADFASALPHLDTRQRSWLKEALFTLYGRHAWLSDHV